ncbi:MAG: phosphatase PAP2 family protein [Jatrophihabitans sp.]|uniref:phosphatase PAP2 family protein n=1 Tax=Jatrophihabitans sp. TaxID=1932789 RepID=UPI003F7E70C6
MGQDAAEVGAPSLVTPAADDARWTLIRRAVGVLYVAGIVTYVALRGVPKSVFALTLVAVLGLLIWCLGRGWRRSLQVVFDWAPFTAVLVGYDKTRGLADSLGIAVHEHDIVRWEKATFGGTEPTVWLQQHLYDAAHVHWYDALLTLVYTSHFVATPVLAAVLWLRDRVYWLRYIARVVVLSVFGLITYILFPEAPPWLAAQDGLTPAVERLSPRGWSWFHLGDVESLLTQAQSGGSNPVAAMPSLHFAMAVLVAAAIAGRLRTRWRWLLALYPAAMGFALVYLGEHWVLDLVAGAVYAAITTWLVARADRWWTARHDGHRLGEHAPLAEPAPAAATAG